MNYKTRLPALGNFRNNFDWICTQIGLNLCIIYAIFLRIQRLFALQNTCSCNKPVLDWTVARYKLGVECFRTLALSNNETKPHCWLCNNACSSKLQCKALVSLELGWGSKCMWSAPSQATSVARDYVSLQVQHSGGCGTAWEAFRTVQVESGHQRDSIGIHGIWRAVRAWLVCRPNTGCL